jgi:hypothetical protein
MEVTLTASPDAPDGFPFEEKKARHALGLTEDEMRALRKTHLAGGSHFVKYKKRLFLSAGGADKLFAAAGQPFPKKTAADQEGLDAVDPAPAKCATAPVTLRVVRNDLRHHHMILACPQDDDPDRPKKTLRVRVRDPKSFIRRTEIPVIPVEGYNDLFDLDHSRPRARQTVKSNQ